MKPKPLLKPMQMVEINKPVGMDSGKNENPYKTNENGVGINKPPRSHFTKSYEAKTLIKIMEMMEYGVLPTHWLPDILTSLLFNFFIFIK